MSIEITFDDQLVKEKAHLDKKILILHGRHRENFEGVNPWFWTKNGNFIIVFGHIRPGNIVWWSSSKNKSPPRL